MTVRVAHLKVSSIPDSDDTSLVRPSDWNEDHVVEGLGTAAEADTGDFATAAQGALADTAVQPAAIASMLETADIGVTVQGYSNNLDEWSGINPSANGASLVSAADYSTMRGLLDLDVGADIQAWSANLDEYAAVNPTAAGLALLDDADNTAQRTTLGLGTAATQNTGTSGANLPFLNGTNTWASAQTFSANPLVNGGGVQFPSTQVPSADANCLDDYEEGSFTPALSATGSTFAYTAQAGRYIKIGRMVYVAIAVSLNTSGNTLTANTLSITGLPFTTSSAAGQRIIGSWQNSTTSYTTVLGFINTSATTINMSALGAAATSYPGSVNADALCHATNGTQLRLTGAYEAA